MRGIFPWPGVSACKHALFQPRPPPVTSKLASPDQCKHWPGRPVRDWEFFLPAVPARLVVLVQPFLSSAPQPTPARVRVARWWPTLIARQGMRSNVHADERVRRSQLRGVAIVVVSLRNTSAFLL